MTFSCKKPGVTFWTVVIVVVVLVAYPLSFGPACWITSRANVGASAIPVLYRPLTLVMSPKYETPVTRLSIWYAEIGAPAGWEWFSTWDVGELPDGTPVERQVAWVWASGSFTLPPLPAITTRAVVDMAQNGISDALIIHVIQTRGGRFDTSPDAEAALTAAGISDAVIEAMRRTSCTDAADNESGGEEDELDRWRRASFSCPSSGRGGKSPP